MKESPVTRKRHTIKDYQKIRRKVSFSLLPPAEIEFDSDVSSSSEDEFRKIPINSSVTQFLNEDDLERSMKYHQQAGNPINSANSDATETFNVLDDANEMLMDIIEEIEAENISVEECLRDAVSLNIIDAECAKTVIKNFDADTLAVEDQMYNNNHSTASDSVTIDKTEADGLNPTDKLLDLLSTLAVGDLSRCCKYTMGKLCKLSSFEDYEAVQKLAAKRELLCESSQAIANETDSASSDFPDDSSIREAGEFSSCGSDNFEDSSGLGSELDFQCGAQLNSTGLEMLPNHSSASESTIKQSLPLLIDMKVLTPRQVWTILGSNDEEALAETFTREISVAIRSTQNRYFLPKKSVEDNFTNLYTRKSNSFAYPGCNSYRSDCNNSKPVERQARSFTVTSARSNSFSYNFKSSNSSSRQNLTPRRIGRRTSANDAFTCKDYAALILWCKENELPSRTAYILHCNGCDSEDDLLELDVENARYIQDFSWNAKTRLIVAIESLRLERHYHHMKKKLAACSSVLKSIPS